MKWAGVNWRMPKSGYVKMNVHGHFQDILFPNGNRSGIGVVIRDSRGMIKAVPDHHYVIQQLNQRKSDQYLSLKINHIDEDANAMAIYLAQHGAANYDQMVIFSEPFGRIFEIWCSDMGLGLVEAPFLGVLEEDINMDAANDVVINEVDDGEGGQEADQMD
ncbi:hypothetical protein POM88_029575 [Heracleum sosnowskyi]|uniref:RNase H type-1 domain-containing protein n=1 Tax=Heracleum sosnowskyi TaxID=360622 RepID=A0AAD8MHV8_9APIA|nr:hypothetical protein POM88_029575 [Heracleum sosnowskyi]